MADSTITQFSEATVLSADDLFETVVDVAGTPTNKKVKARLVAGGFAHAAGSDANTSMAVNTLYTVDMSGWATADRTYTLPAVAAVGDRVGIIVTAGDASHELIITAAAGDTLNGVAGGTEWSRVFITGEVVMMRCVTANAAWVIEHDGRIPQIGVLRLSTSAASSEAGNTYTSPTANSGVWTAETDVGSVTVAASDQIKTRRAGKFIASCAGASVGTITDQNYFNLSLWKTGTRNQIMNNFMHSPVTAIMTLPSKSTVVTLAC